jgi:hypothetical protein
MYFHFMKNDVNSTYTPKTELFYFSRTNTVKVKKVNVSLDGLKYYEYKNFQPTSSRAVLHLLCP